MLGKGMGGMSREFEAGKVVTDCYHLGFLDKSPMGGTNCGRCGDWRGGVQNDIKGTGVGGDCA
jgi:hypothetical protein